MPDAKRTPAMKPTAMYDERLEEPEHERAAELAEQQRHVAASASATAGS